MKSSRPTTPNFADSHGTAFSSREVGRGRLQTAGSFSGREVSSISGHMRSSWARNGGFILSSDLLF